MIRIFVSILYLWWISQYNLRKYNDIRYATNWFLHPYDGGVCVFGQVMAWLTCVVLLTLCYLRIYPITIFLFLSLSWLFLPALMNNEWLSIASIPLCLIWISVIM